MAAQQTSPNLDGVRSLIERALRELEPNYCFPPGSPEARACGDAEEAFRCLVDAAGTLADRAGVTSGIGLTEPTDRGYRLLLGGL